jgi:RNA polymerase sigma-70 factor (ECF subfamily)
VRRYQDVAVRTAHLVCPEADADDAVQEAFLKAFAALSRFRDGAPLRPWLLRIVANEARNRRRAAGRRQGLALRAAATSGDGPFRAPRLP